MAVIPRASYLGDSVYVEYDGRGLWLTTNNGGEPSNRIFLEPEVYEALRMFVERLSKTSLEET